MTELSEGLLDKVRKLLAKAEDPGCTPAEADALNDKAAELIAKYGIEAAMLTGGVGAGDAVTKRDVVVSAPYAQEKVLLLFGVARSLRCNGVRTINRGGCTLHLFGFGSDLERVELLYTSLLVQASRGLAVARPPAWRQSESTAAYRRTWLSGFAFEVVRRLKAAERQAARNAEQRSEGTPGPSVALVLAGRTREVDAAMAEAYPYTKARGPRRLSGSGYSSGRAAGAQADLGGSRVTESRRAAIGVRP